jgi:16S rRNA (adenine1518-N6/adenine1519-N6)-dimethyltransferase
MNLRANKRLGQHFLHDPAIVEKIVKTIAPEPNDLMVEIGGGHGALTFPLVEHLNQLHVVELDGQLADQLVDRCPKPKRLRVYRMDALKFDFSGLARSKASLRVVGNLPYNISTPLLFHLLTHRTAIRDMYLMLQKEVANRMTAAPGSKQYGRLTVNLALWAEPKACFDVGPGAFNPAPKVWSTIVGLQPSAKPRFAVKNPGHFSKLVTRAFSMRRKTIANSLKGWLEPEKIRRAQINPRARPETLTPGEFAKLSNLCCKTTVDPSQLSKNP